MQLSFKNNISESDASKLEAVLSSNRTTVLLNHANYCGHCHAMRSEFELFKKTTTTNVVEIESSSLDSLQRRTILYKKISSSEGMYFPMIIIFIARSNQPPLKLHYQGPRNSEEIHKFIKAHETKFSKKPKAASVPVKAPVKAALVSAKAPSKAASVPAKAPSKARKVPIKPKSK